MDRVDAILGALLGQKEPVSQLCPKGKAMQELALSDRAGDKHEALLAHAADCPDCLAILGSALGAKEKLPMPIQNRLPKESAWKGTGRISAFMRRHGWLALSLSFFILSLFVSRYFVQCMVLTLIFGLKWIFDTATNRQIIMIYDAWKKRSEEKKHE